MARPRKVSDAELLAACASAIGLHGPGFTLAHVAAAADVSVGTVVGRFGSKHQLLVTLMETETATLGQRMRAAGEKAANPVDAVKAAVLATSDGIDDPATTANHLAQLGADLADPDLRRRLAAHRQVIRTVLTELVATAGLPSAPPPRQAGAMLAALVHGAQVDWALQPKGSLHKRIRRDVDILLDGWARTEKR
ncbi:TetR/AcrR family transcriptional regulator [Prauserella shujinwangii]|nr:TetR family transcriptional regulator C-terminal domain-containing protein [Prauserella shujinwangii]